MIRDFQIPQSLILQLSNAPTPIFFTSYTLDALPQLNGSVSYITTSEVLERVRLLNRCHPIHQVHRLTTQIGPSASTPFRYVVDRFKVFPPPGRPAPKDEVWQGGRRVEGRGELTKLGWAFKAKTQTTYSIPDCISHPSTSRA